jgi:2-polyprenyl-3-methyl-5-hydroxy-6-metoxy-1,4-benzoquinol methylase/cephalosporin-C deacetylase-like acetyl esterase
MVRLLQRNYPDGQLLELYGRPHEPPPPANPKAFTEFLEELGPDDWEKVRCMTGHSVHFVIPVLDRPFRAFTLVRDPVDRVVSLYHYLKARPPADGRGGVAGSAIRTQDLSLPEILHRFEGMRPIDADENALFANFFNGQTRSLLAAHYRVGTLPLVGRPDNHDELQQLMKAVLSEHYVVGAADRFGASVGRFASAFGWEDTTLFRENVNKNRPALAELPEDVVEQIRACNTLDDQLYRSVVRELDEESAAREGDEAVAAGGNGDMRPSSPTPSPAPPAAPPVPSANDESVTATPTDDDRITDVFLTGKPASVDYIEPEELVRDIVTDQRPIETEVLEKWVEKEVECVELRLLSEIYKGEKIFMHGWLCRPLDEPGLLAPVLVIPGGRGEMPDARSPIWIAGTTRGVVLAVDWIGAGRSSHLSDLSPWRNAMRFEGDYRNSYQYHNLRALMRATEVLLTQPDADVSQLTAVGGSWGGFYSWLLAGIDPRFKYIFPTFGCGYLDTEARQVWESYFTSMGPEKTEEWLKAFDPGRRVHLVKAAVFYQQATNDRFYSMPASMETYRRVRTEKRLLLAYNQDHTTEPYYAQDTAMVRAVLDGAESEAMPEIHSANWIPGTNLVEVEAARTDRVSLSVVFSAGSYTTSFGRYWREVPAQLRDGRYVAEIPVVDPKREIWFYGHAVLPASRKARERARGAFTPPRRFLRGASTLPQRIVPAELGLREPTAEFDPSFSFAGKDYWQLPIGDRHFPALSLVEDEGTTALAMRFGADPNRRGVAYCLEGDLIEAGGYDGIEVRVRVPDNDHQPGLKLCLITDYNALAEQDYVVDLDDLKLDFTRWQTVRVPFTAFEATRHRAYEFYQPPLKPLDVSRLCAVGFYHSELDYRGEGRLGEIRVVHMQEPPREQESPADSAGSTAPPARSEDVAEGLDPYDIYIETSLPAEELRDALRRWEPYRHELIFSNGVRTSELETGEPFLAHPAFGWSVFAQHIPEAALRGRRALDVGSNIGHHSLYLRTRYEMEVLGLEINERNLAIANFLVRTSGIDRVRYLAEDADSYVDDQPFQLILHRAVLDQLKDPFLALENAAAMLEPGGFLALATETYKDPSGDESICKFVPRERGARGGSCWLLGKDALLNMIEQAGFTDVQIVLEWSPPNQRTTSRRLSVVARAPADEGQ